MPPGIAAVIAITFGSSSARSISESENVFVHEGREPAPFDGAGSFSTSGVFGETPWNLIGSASASSKPFPFSVST